MALIIEDGSVVTGAQSYASYLDLTNRMAGLTGAPVVANPYTQPQLENYLLQAMEYLETESFQGGKTKPNIQPLQWPRWGVVVREKYLLPNQIPPELIQAQCALAIDAITLDLLPTTTPTGIRGEVVQESVSGAVSVSYAHLGMQRTLNRYSRYRNLIDLLTKTAAAKVLRA